MSDEHDELSESLLTALLIQYGELREACQALPVPIQLPVGIGQIIELIEAVGRCFEIAQDQPIPEEAQADLEMSCLHWLTASDLIGLYRHDIGGYDHRDRAAELALLGMELSLKSLQDWLSQQS
ncbi:hypothetical protein QFW82_23570 [Streptomyces malaysiensis subsp. malaysiensis]|uniref:hypothetical protein n=1 Tax=Streptomyces malaysiensis TaxID=92644 RepID=UPI0024C045B7|nr:hypothetical protein [Streptomyces sp. NA07423]WHX19811.1 hypothetical protein QFW82_23570 [Streptomyces sp. NA07423]